MFPGQRAAKPSRTGKTGSCRGLEKEGLNATASRDRITIFHRRCTRDACHFERSCAGRCQLVRVDARCRIVAAVDLLARAHRQSDSGTARCIGDRHSRRFSYANRRAGNRARTVRTPSSRVSSTFIESRRDGAAACADSCVARLVFPGSLPPAVVPRRERSRADCPRGRISTRPRATIHRETSPGIG